MRSIISYRTGSVLSRLPLAYPLQVDISLLPRTPSLETSVIRLRDLQFHSIAVSVVQIDGAGIANESFLEIGHEL